MKEDMLDVLILDDEPHVSQLIVSLIDWESLSMRVCGTAQDGKTGLDMISRLKPDLVITDIRMPGYDGLELIQRARASRPDLDFIIISGFKHFEYARTAIKYGVEDYLLKPIKKQELTDTLLKLTHKHREHRLHTDRNHTLSDHLHKYYAKLRADLYDDYIISPATTGKSLEEAASLYHYSFSPGLFQICIIKVDAPSEDFLPSPVLQSMSNKVRTIIEKHGKSFCHDMEVYIRESRFTVLLNYSPDQEAEVSKALKKVLDDLVLQQTMFPDVRFTLALGNPQEKLDAIHISADEAWQACCQRLLSTGPRIIPPQALQTPHGDISPLLLAWSGSLPRILEALDAQEASQCAEELSTGLLAIPDIMGVHILQTLLQAWQAFRSLALTMHPALLSILPEEAAFSSGLDLNPSAQAACAFFSAQIVGTTTALACGMQDMEYRPVRQAKQYIHTHFADPLISLNSVSEAIGFNPSYFSALFKKEGGTGFLTYLSEIRMNHAKYLLKTTNLSIGEITHQCGYTDAKYFAQAFRKYAGIKPKDFRKLYA